MNTTTLIKTRPMLCPLCGKFHEVEERVRFTNVTVKGRKVTYRETFYKCKNTPAEESEFMTGITVNENLKNAREAYAKMCEKEDRMNDYEQMILSAVRYALGRRTYIVQTATKYVINHMDEFSDACLSIMQKDIKNQYMFLQLGDSCDEKVWGELYYKIEEKLRPKK